MPGNRIYFESVGRYNIAQSISYQTPDFDIHAHDSYELYYFLSGDVTYYIEGKGYKVDTNDILLINNRELHKPNFNSEKPYKRITVHFNPGFIKDLNYNDQFDLLSCFKDREPGQHNKIDSEDILNYKIDRYFDRIVNYIKEDTAESAIMIETLFIQAMVLLNKIFKQKKELHLDTIEYDDNIMEIINFINNNLARKITLDKLEKRFYLNKYYLCHLFKENTGFSVKQYITYKRVLKAKELLTSGNSCSETCNSLGFGDYSNFYRIFKKAVGLSPQEYINQSK